MPRCPLAASRTRAMAQKAGSEAMDAYLNARAVTIMNV
jgi:hypothetical protein